MHNANSKRANETTYKTIHKCDICYKSLHSLTVQMDDLSNAAENIHIYFQENTEEVTSPGLSSRQPDSKQSKNARNFSAAVVDRVPYTQYSNTTRDLHGVGTDRQSDVQSSTSTTDLHGVCKAEGLVRSTAHARAQWF